MGKSKKKLLIFSQCHIYGGSERLMQSIYKSETLNKFYDIYFAYSYFKDYADGIRRDCNSQNILSVITPLYLLTNGNIFNKINLKYSNKSLRRILKSPLFLVHLTGLYFLYNFIYFTLFLIYLKPNIVHINNGGYPAAKACNTLAIVLIFFPKIKVVYQVNNKAETRTSFFSKILDFLVSTSVDTFLTHSVQNMEALILRGFNDNSVISIPSYFSETILTSLLSKEEIRKGKFTLCMVGFLSYRKGQMYLLKAITEIKNRNHQLISNLQLNLIGEGEEHVALKKYIDEYELNDVVTLWGLRSDYIQFIHECDIYMLTSVEGEDLPLVLLTAMQSKRCIVASDFAGISDLLTHKVDAILVTPNLDTITNEIADAIIYLFEHPEIRDKLSENVGVTYEEKLGEEKYAYNLIELYKAESK